RRKGELSGQNFRVVLLHTLHDPRLQNGSAGKIGDEVGWLFPGSGSLLIADARMGGVVAEGPRSARNNGKIYVEGEPRDMVRREIRRRCFLLRRRSGGERQIDQARQDAAGKQVC